MFSILILLGALCRKLAGQCDDFLEKLDHIRELGVYIHRLLGFLADRVLLAKLNLQLTIFSKRVDWAGQRTLKAVL
jgi:hypothetical protein